MRLDELLAAKEIVVTCGSGGVGKTTTAAALATMAAAVALRTPRTGTRSTPLASGVGLVDGGPSETTGRGLAGGKCRGRRSGVPASSGVAP